MLYTAGPFSVTFGSDQRVQGCRSPRTVGHRFFTPIRRSYRMWSGPHLQVCLMREHLQRTGLIALIVGTWLMIFNQFGPLLAWDIGVLLSVKVCLNYLTPFIVANAGLFSREGGCGPRRNQRRRSLWVSGRIQQPAGANQCTGVWERTQTKRTIARDPARKRARMVRLSPLPSRAVAVAHPAGRDSSPIPSVRTLRTLFQQPPGWCRGRGRHHRCRG